MGLWNILLSICDAANKERQKVLDRADAQGLRVRDDARRQIEGYSNSNFRRDLEFKANRESRREMIEAMQRYNKR